MGALVAHGQLDVYQDHQVLFTKLPSSLSVSMWFILLQARIFSHSFLLDFLRFLSAHFSSRSKFLSVEALPSNALAMPFRHTFDAVWKLAENFSFLIFLASTLYSSTNLMALPDILKIDQNDPIFSFNRTSAIVLSLIFTALPFVSGKKPIGILRLFFVIYNKFCFCCCSGSGLELFFILFF